MARRWLAVALVGSLVAVFAACGGDDGGGGIVDQATTDEQRDDVQEAREEDQETTSNEELPYQEAIDLSLDDIQAFWTEELPVSYGVDYTELGPDQIIPYDENTDPTEYSECYADVGATYDDVANNAFYCSLDQTISYDDQGLFPDLYDRFGPFALTMVLAHEWGHAIQDQTYGLIDLNQTTETVYVETQADCFAGGFVDYLASGAANLELKEGDLDTGVAGMLSFADPIGTSPDEPGAHGAGFDRVLSFQRGYNEGAASCFEWDVNPPQIVEVPFTDEEDFANQGNAPLTDLLEFIPDDLDIYWTQVVETTGATYDGVDDIVPVTTDEPTDACSSMENEDIAGEVLYCQGDDTIVYDEQLVDVVYNDIGDFGVAVLISNAWANAMQDELEVSSTDPLELGLQADCFSGAWAGGLAVDLEGTTQARGLPVDREVLITFSPGDLDEVVQAFILYGDQAETRGSGFDRVQQFAQAFFSETAEADCAAITEG